MNTSQKQPTDKSAEENKRQLRAAQRDWKPWDEARSAYVDWAWSIVEPYYQLKARLEQEGFLLDCDQEFWPTFAPVQIAGFLPTGEAFYFRCRWDTCSLRIAPADGDPVRQPTWEESVSRWGEYEAGGLEAEEAEAVLRELLARHRQADAKEPGATEAS